MKNLKQSMRLIKLSVMKRHERFMINIDYKGQIILIIIIIKRVVIINHIEKPHIIMVMEEDQIKLRIKNLWQNKMPNIIVKKMIMMIKFILII